MRTRAIRSDRRQPTKGLLRTVVERLRGDVEAAEVFGMSVKPEAVQVRYAAWRRLLDLGYSNLGIARAWGCHHTAIIKAMRRCGLTPAVQEDMAA